MYSQCHMYVHVLFIFHSTFFNSPSSRSDIYAIIEFFPIQFLPPHIFASFFFHMKKIYEEAKKRTRTEKEEWQQDWIGYFYVYPYERKEIYYETYFMEVEEMNI